MSDLTVTFHGLESLFAGTSSFTQFEQGELAMFKANIAALPAALQPTTTLIVDSLAEGASSLVGAGETAIGPILNESSDAQATMFLNVLQKVGVPTGGAVLSIAEHAALVTVLNGLKAGLDRIGLQISTAGITAKPTITAATPGPQ